MDRTHRIALVFLLGGLTAAIGTAQPKADIKGSNDHPLISRYPGAVISKYSTIEFDEFTLPLGKVTSNKLEKSQPLEGRITRLVYDVPAGRSVLEVYRNYETALAKAGFEVLFACVNVDGCGSSRPTLHAGTGSEDWNWQAGQRYLSAKMARKEGDVYVSLHIGQWRDRNYGPAVTLYVVEVKPMEAGLIKVEAAALASDITKTGHSAVYGIYFDTGKADVKAESDAALREIAKLLQQNASMKLLVVGHTDNVGGLPSNMDLSKRRAEAVVHSLTSKYGVAPSRLLAQGAGPLSPVDTNKTEDGRAKNRRVELVEQ